MKPKKEKITAADFLAQLHSDPEWVRQNEERQACHKARVAQLKSELEPEERPLVAELAEMGYAVSSVWELVNAKTRYPTAIPVLVKYLVESRHPVLRNGIARALTVPEARGIAGRKILDELKAEKDPFGSEERWALANALTVVADGAVVDEIKTMLDDARYEDVHERFATALKNLQTG